jgi:hypothetical protein
MADPQSGKNLGRAKIDWEQAFLYYASLPPDQRDYLTVAMKFEVSVRTVEGRGRGADWVRRARQIDQDATKRAATQLASERAEKLVETEKLVDATYVSYANQLVAGQVKITPTHLVRMFELRERVWESQDSEFSEPIAASRDPDPVDPLERKREVLRALHDAGVLQRLINDQPSHAQPPADHDDSASQSATPPDGEEAAT